VASLHPSKPGKAFFCCCCCWCSACVRGGSAGRPQAGQSLARRPADEASFVVCPHRSHAGENAWANGMHGAGRRTESSNALRSAKPPTARPAVARLPKFKQHLHNMQINVTVLHV
jgi:hypothetical protein